MHTTFPKLQMLLGWKLLRFIIVTICPKNAQWIECGVIIFSEGSSTADYRPAGWTTKRTLSYSPLKNATTLLAAVRLASSRAVSE